MDVARAVVAHRLHVKIFQQIKRLQHHRPLRPARQFVNLDAFVGRRHRFFNPGFPVHQVRKRMQTALLA